MQLTTNQTTKQRLKVAYQLDKSYAKAQSFAEADNQYVYWEKQSVEERLKASWYITCQAYGLEYSTQHKLDKTVHSTRKHW